MHRDAFLDSTQPAVFYTTGPLVREQPLPQDEVERIQRELGLDVMQARNHVRGLLILRARVVKPA